MTVVEIKLLEDCFDGSLIKEFIVDECVSKEVILYLGQDSSLQYFPTFARPFYKIDVPGNYSIKGVENNKTIRVLLSGSDREGTQRILVDKINSFPDNF